MGTKAGRKRGNWEKAAGVLVLTFIMMMAVSGLAWADINVTQAPLLSRGNALELIGSVGPSGAASQSISIAVPPGRRGMQPGITIGYSSSGGQSEYGYGWGYDPGSIERSTKDGVPRNFTTEDKFLLNGMDLVRISVGASYDEYKTERESFSQILGYKSGSDYDYWIVKDKSGTTYYYGDTGAANSEIVVTGKTAVRKWGLRQVTDTNGNSYTVTYMTDATNSPGAIFPSVITYNVNGTNNMTVNFTWELRPDIIESYRDGGQVKTAYRLRSIETRIGANRARKYDFTYTQSSSTNRSLLTSIKEYGDSTDTVGLPARTFEYSTSGNSGWDPWTWSLPVEPNGTTVRMMDINGDGLPDLVDAGTSRAFLNNGDGTFTQTSWSFPAGFTFGKFTIDYNGDRREETEGYINTGTGFTQNGWQMPPLVGIDSWSAQCNGVDASSTRRWMDVNGDGLLDAVDGYSFVGKYRGSMTYRKIWLNNGDGTFTDATANYSIPADFPYFLSASDNQSGYCYDTAVWVWNNSIADFNGDGLDEPQGFINTGSGFVAKAISPLPYPTAEGDNCGQHWSTVGSEEARRWMDINGDGLLDAVDAFQLLQCTGTPIGPIVYKAQINKGDGTFTDVTLSTTFPNLAFGWHKGIYCSGGCSEYLGYQSANVLIADLNGDGFAEPRGYKNRGQKPDLLVRATNGIGGSVNYAYQVWSHAGVAVPMPVRVVSSVTVNDGLGNASTTSYSYSGGYWKPRSGGKPSEFRGFRTVTVTNPDGSKTVTYYLQGDIYKGLVEKSYIKDSSNNIYAVTTNTYDYMETNNANTVKTDESLAAGGVYFARLRDTYSYSVEGATANEILAVGTYRRNQNSFSYDIYGNVTDNTNYGEIDGGSSADIGYDKKQTLTSYLNDTGSHILGVPCQVIVNGYNKDNVWVTQRQSKMYYDDSNTNCSQSVPRGNLTKIDSYIDATNFVTVSMGYDARGNLKRTVDAKNNYNTTCGATTCIDYDATYNAFPVKTCNVNDFCGTITYDSLMRPTQAVDINGQTTSTAYDVFGRVTAVAKPLDTLASPTVQTVYNDTASLPSNPAYVKTIAKDGTVNGLISYTFIDGLGRTIQTKSVGVGANEWYTTAIYYNAQGRLDRSGVVYTTIGTPEVNSRRGIGDAGVWTIPTYDSIGRVIRTTKPDGTYGEVIFDKWVTTVKDALGRKKVTYVDGLGMTTKVENYTGDGSASKPYALYSITNYKYNTGTGELVQITNYAP